MSWRGRFRRAFGYPEVANADVVVVGGRRAGWGGELYHHHLRASWWVSIGAIVLGFLAINLGFAVVYAVAGGIANMREGSVVDAFFFSVHTMATIGYGSMYPTSTLANALVVAESIVGLLVTAVSTGLVFAKFTVPAARIRFSRCVVVSPVDGVPTLSLRVGNERGNAVVDATFHVSVTRTEITKEGRIYYRFHELPLARDRAASLYTSWNLFHRIGPDSPLHGVGPAEAAAQELEVVVSLAGTDDTTFQPVFARHRYDTAELRFGWRLADVLQSRADGTLELHVDRFDDLEPTEPIDGFPYPAAPPGRPGARPRS